MIDKIFTEKEKSPNFNLTTNLFNLNKLQNKNILKPTTNKKCFKKFLVNDLLMSNNKTKKNELLSNSILKNNKNELKMSKLFPFINSTDKAMAVAATLNFGK